MRRLLLRAAAVVFIILTVSGTISAFASKPPEPATPRADVYWAEARLHMKIWSIEPAPNGTWRITYDIKLNGPRGVALTVPMDRPPFEPGQMVFAEGKVAQTGDVLITSLEDDPDDPPAASPSPVSGTTGTTARRRHQASLPLVRPDSADNGFARECLTGKPASG